MFCAAWRLKLTPQDGVQVPPLFESTVLLGNLSQQKWCKEGMTINLYGKMSEHAQTPKMNSLWLFLGLGTQLLTDAENKWR